MATEMLSFKVVASTETMTIDWSEIIYKKNEITITPSFCVYDGNVLVGYCSIVKGPYFFDEYKTSVVEIKSLEVHHDYRRRGIATKLLNRVVDENPGVHIVLDSTGDALPFYAKYGFKLLYYITPALKTHTLIKPIDGFNVREVARSKKGYKNKDGHPIRTDKSGCVWVDSQSRFVNLDRTYDQELVDVRGNCWEIETVAVQTPELQVLSITDKYPYVISWIDNPCKEAIKLAISFDTKYTKLLKV